MSAPAGLYNIVADQGSTLSRTIIWRDPAKKPILLNGYQGRMQVRPTVTSTTVVLNLTTENGGITLGETDGTITVYITDEVMTTVFEGQYAYDLELIGPDHIYAYKLLYGNFVVRPEVTR
jgi:hypothetical protein